MYRVLIIVCLSVLVLAQYERYPSEYDSGPAYAADGSYGGENAGYEDSSGYNSYSSEGGYPASFGGSENTGYDIDNYESVPSYASEEYGHAIGGYEQNPFNGVSRLINYNYRK